MTDDDVNDDDEICAAMCHICHVMGHTYHMLMTPMPVHRRIEYRLQT